MSESEITRLYESLSLAEEDGAVLEMEEEVQIKGFEDIDRCSVGKVLSGKKINREAFKGLIEQIWLPFGQVEVELVGDNIFMFYFVNQEDRNKVWQRGPWHFGKSLIVLEKPMGTGNISKLGFNKADFWVQIHDIPILCMNLRIAKWMAEQLEEVVESHLSPESVGITMVGLRYEWLPDFCYACRRIGHVMNECQHEEARNVALDGTPTRFGLWLKAQVLEKLKPRVNSQLFGSSSKRSRSHEVSREDEGDGYVSLKQGSKSITVSSVSRTAVAKVCGKEKQLETLIPIEGIGTSQEDVTCVDGQEKELLGRPNELGQRRSGANI
ncbi:hypothetical protein EZV62_010834 [Acer yangbiense]|uniref:CCHC-type domain-containing protein n=1 Tax=Acer yangbiense TaxID=1000413 RepID=A0A5C7I3N7_9ROSI|nr:hypothetical protein EZV62_010834 [Acer yangbiense]